eukprot:3397815-Amphidinium_carterae.2
MAKLTFDMMNFGHDPYFPSPLHGNRASQTSRRATSYSRAGDENLLDSRLSTNCGTYLSGPNQYKYDDYIFYKVINMEDIAPNLRSR